MLQKTNTILLLLGLMAVALTGCVQRRFIVRSQPEGAAVMIDNVPVGSTPLSVPYTYSGTREFKLEKPGYKMIQVQQRFPPTWYEVFPISFFTENFWPREIRDERMLDFQMEPKTQVQEDRLLERANELRCNVQRGTVTAPIK